MPANMRAAAPVLGSLLIAAGLPSCATHVDYTPKTGRFPPGIAKVRIGAVLRAEPKSELRVHVTDTYFKVTWYSPGAPMIHVPAGPRTRTVHFADVADFEFTKKKRQYRVELLDEGGCRVYLLKTTQEREAREFADAVLAMREHLKAGAKEPR